MSGYPYRNESSRFPRDPYDARTLHHLDRASDPYATRHTDPFARDDYGRRAHGTNRHSHDSLLRAPLVTITEPAERQRHSISPLQRAGPFGAFARISASPPPRASGRRFDRFEEAFGGVPGPDRTYRDERLQMGPFGPSRGPFTTRQVQDHCREPFGGLGGPRNSFARGGGRYEDDFVAAGSRSDPDARFEEQERRRRNYYRS